MLCSSKNKFKNRFNKNNKVNLNITELMKDRNLNLNFSNECPICLENININSINLNCNHQLHKNCFIKLYNTNPDITCPLCREIILI